MKGSSKTCQVGNECEEEGVLTLDEAGLGKAVGWQECRKRRESRENPLCPRKEVLTLTIERTRGDS